MARRKRKRYRKIDGKKYGYTGKFSWTKKNAKKKAKALRKKYPKRSYRTLKYKTVGSRKKTGYLIWTKIKRRRKKKR